MKILKLRIKNYKSIIDSGDCYLTNGVTVIAGKNESGKTSVLQALEDFNKDVSIRDKSKPINKSELPIISILFQFTPDEINPILHSCGVSDNLEKAVEVGLVKTYPKEYSFTDETTELLNKILAKAKPIPLDPQDWKELQVILNKYPTIVNSYDTKINFKDSDAEQKITELRDYIKENISLITIAEDQITATTYLEQIITEMEKARDAHAITIALDGICDKLIPNFIFFDSFDDTFPDEVTFANIDSDKWVRDLSLISNLSADVIKSGVERDKKNHKQKINIQLNDDYKKFWTQDISSLNIDWDSEKITFWIEDKGESFEPSLRSKGRQWHLAFYIKISARSKEDLNNIILIDEPGLYLHATAQEDILRKLESSAQDDNKQLIFSTHSPYLLEADKLNRIRLIIHDDKEGTKIINKVHALADKETLTPILTAIGLELSAGIGDIGKTHNVVVEGPSDVYYLNAFKNILNLSDLNFIYGGGAGNMPVVGTILHGWGCKVLYLYDKDQGKKNGEKNLTKNWLVSKDLIFSVLDSEGTIEDILSSEDFKKYVLEDNSNKYSIKNSEFVKESKSDKVLLAKCFLENTDKNKEAITLSKASIDNINKLYKKLSDKINEPSI